MVGVGAQVADSVAMYEIVGVPRPCAGIEGKGIICGVIG